MILKAFHAIIFMQCEALPLAKLPLTIGGKSVPGRGAPGQDGRANGTTLRDHCVNIRVAPLP